jgi:hypothetical protein
MAAAAAEPNGASIEALFRPSTRFRDSHRNRRGRLREGWTEVELLPHLTPLDILATGVTWDEFLIFFRNKIAWMTPDVYVCNSMHLPGAGDRSVLDIAANGRTASMMFTRLRVYTTPGTAAAVATATCDFAVRLLATSEQRDLYITGGRDTVSTPLSGAALSLFFQECRDSLQKFTLSFMILSEDQCLALATMSRFDVELTMAGCRLSNNAPCAFVECLQSDRGPVELVCCEIDNQVLANALTGDSRVTKFRPFFVLSTDDADLAILLRALANNRGLVDLDLSGNRISDENWTIMCQSLQAHLSLTSLNLEETRPMGPAEDRIILSAEQTTRRTRALAEMMQQNTVLHTIELAAFERDGQIYTEEIRPYLVTNLYRPRVLAVKKTKDRPFREKVLGRAVYSVRSNPNLVWMLLSENVDAFVRSEEEEESNSEESVVAAAAAIVLTVAGSKRKR